MTLEKDIAKMKEDVKSLKRRPVSVGRPGLYVMVFVAMLYAVQNSCDINDMKYECSEDYKPGYELIRD